MSEGEEIVKGLTEAQELSKIAVSFDKKRKYDAAVDYYDKAILNIDDTLNILPPSSEEFGKLLSYRKQLETRMELLAAHVNDGGVMAPPAPPGGGEEIDDMKNYESFQKDGFLTYNDDEMTGFVKTFEADTAPSSIASLPYWQLRRISATVKTGGLLTRSLCVPKAVWFNDSARFSGLAAKISFLKDTSSVITINIEPLLQEQIPRVDGVLDEYIKRIRRSRGVEDSETIRGLDGPNQTRGEEAARLHSINETIVASREAFVTLQNQLAKSFYYIVEEVGEGEGEEDGVGSDKGDDGNNSLPPPSWESEREGSNSGHSVSGLTGAVQGLGSFGLGVVGGVGKGLSEGMSLVGHLGKHVKKYAEVGISRINASVSSKISVQELRVFTTLIVDVADRVQVFDGWYAYFEGLRNHLLECDDMAKQQALLEVTESALTNLLLVSKFMKEVLTALLLKELEELLESYISKHTKAALDVD